jgi:hypothetical protein
MQLHKQLKEVSTLFRASLPHAVQNASAKNLEPIKGWTLFRASLPSAVENTSEPELQKPTERQKVGRFLVPRWEHKNAKQGTTPEMQTEKEGWTPCCICIRNRKEGKGVSSKPICH